MKNLFSLIICLLMTSWITSVYGQTNIAAGKSAKQSSTYGSYPANLATDGVKEGFGKLSHTNSELGAWWEIDLGASYAIASIKVYNAKDHPTRMNDFTILVSETAFTGNTGGTAFVSNEPAPMPTKSYTGNATGRYVRLFLNGTNYLTIHEIEIFGTLQTGTTPVATNNKRITSTEMNGVSVKKGTVILHNESSEYDLYVFKDELGKEGEEIGKLQADRELTLKNIERGTYLRFKAYGSDGNIDDVKTTPLFLWNVDDYDYFVYAQAASDVREQGFPIGPNLHGINLTTLNPRDIQGGKEDGQIFEGMESATVDYKSVKGAPGLYIKEGFYHSDEIKGKGNNSQKMRYKAESVKNSWSINVDLKGSVPLKSGARVDGGVGVGYSEFDETHSNQKEIYLEKSEWKSKYVIKCDSSRADLTKRFKVAVKALPLDYNGTTKNDYKDFVNTYGTHFLSEVVYGGFYNTYLTMSESSFNTLQGNALDVKTELAISKGGAKKTTNTTTPALGAVTGQKERAVETSSNNSKAGSLSISYSEDHEEELTEQFMEMEGGYEYGGGDGNFDNWTLSDDNAIPIIIKPQLISVLISPEVFRDDTDHKKLRDIKSNLEDYLTEYIGNMPKKNLLDAPPIGYTLRIKEVKITDYKDEMDATKKADISIMAYSGLLKTLKANNPQLSFRNGEVDKQLVREAKINPEQNVNKPLDLVSQEIGLVVKAGNPDQRVFKIVGTFKEEDSNFGGTPEEWVASGYINTDLTDSNPTRNGELTLKHSAVRWGAKQQFDVIVKYELTRNADLFDIPDGAQVKQSNQSEQISTTELVNDAALNAPIQITFKHKGAYIAKYNITYTHDGQPVNITTGEVTSVSEGTYDIPSDATNVIVKAEGLTGLVWAPVTVHFQQTYPKAVTRIIESYGSTLDQSYKELDGAGKIVSQGSAPPPPSNKKRISFVNKGAYNAKYTISYTLNGQAKTENSGELLGGQKKDFEISADAINVTIIAEGATGLVWSKWTTHFKQTYPKTQDRTIESHGTTLNQSYKEYDIKGGIVSQGNTPPPPADTQRVTFKNRGAYTAKYTLTYVLQGRNVVENSGKILSGRDKFYDIPRVATNVSIKAEGFTGWFEETQTHYEKTFPTAVTIVIESQGAARGQSAKVN